MGTTADKLQAIINTKTSIKNAINGKGGQIDASTPFANYATAITNLPSGLEKMYVVQTINGDTSTLAITTSGVEANAQIVGQLITDSTGKIYIVEV